jgi:hypothetical protein
LGSKAQLEIDILILAKVFHWPPESIKLMPSSQRRRMMRLQEEVTKQENAAAKGQTTVPQPTTPTGLGPASDNQEAIGINYTGI